MLKLFPRNEIPGNDRAQPQTPIDPEFMRVVDEIHDAVPDSGYGPVSDADSAVQLYRLTTNPGMWAHNLESGWLKLQIEPFEGGQRIHFCQVSIDGGSTARNRQSYTPHHAFCRVSGWMQCRNGAIQSWQLKSGIFHQSGAGEIPVNQTMYAEQGRVLEAALEVEIDGKTFNRKRVSAAPLISEWNILSLVGSFPFREGVAARYNLFEGLSLQKPDASLVYMGRHATPHWGGELHVFSLVGRGIVPLDYWLDSEHRLICCLSGGLGRGFVPQPMVKPNPMFAFLKQALI
jgi:hypothetical protein